MNDKQQSKVYSDVLFKEANEIEKRTKAGGMYTRNMVEKAETILEAPQGEHTKNDV